MLTTINQQIKSHKRVLNADNVGSLASEVYLMDCIQGMKHYPDKWFDLAVCDPPYGINRSGQNETFPKNIKHKRKHFENKGWDLLIPKIHYFTELFRASKNQIIWGANYFIKSYCIYLINTVVLFSQASCMYCILN